MKQDKSNNTCNLLKMKKWFEGGGYFFSTGFHGWTENISSRRRVSKEMLTVNLSFYGAMALSKWATPVYPHAGSLEAILFFENVFFLEQPHRCRPTTIKSNTWPMSFVVRRDRICRKVQKTTHQISAWHAWTRLTEGWPPYSTIFDESSGGCPQGCTIPRRGQANVAAYLWVAYFEL